MLMRTNNEKNGPNVGIPVPDLLVLNKPFRPSAKPAAFDEKQASKPHL